MAAANAAAIHSWRPPLATGNPNRFPPGNHRAASAFRRCCRGERRTDYLAVTGAAVGGVSLTAGLFSEVAPFTGALGFVVFSYLVFIGSYALLVSLDESGPAVRDRMEETAESFSVLGLPPDSRLSRRPATRASPGPGCPLRPTV